MNFIPPRDTISKSKRLIIAPFYVAYFDTRANMGKLAIKPRGGSNSRRAMPPYYPQETTFFCDSIGLQYFQIFKTLN